MLICGCLVPGQINQSPLGLSYVLQANNDQWQGNQRGSLYAHSWGLVYFLMSSREGKNLLQRYLMAAAKSPCVELNGRAFIQQHYAGGVVNFDRQFKGWLRGRKSAHHI